MTNLVLLSAVLIFCLLFWSWLIAALIAASVAWGVMWGIDLAEASDDAEERFERFQKKWER